MLEDIFDFTKPWKPAEPSREGIASDDYRSFDEYFRGTPHALNGRKDELDDLIAWIKDNSSSKNLTSLADIGCGEGLLLEAAKKSGFNAVGVESSPELADRALIAGHRVLCGDAIEFLEKIEINNALMDVITINHLIEHLQPEQAELLIKLALRCLTPQGSLVITTPNHRSEKVMLGSFYRDPTHLRPYPLDLLDFFVHKHGGITVFKTNFYRFLSRQNNDEKSHEEKKFQEIINNINSHIPQILDENAKRAIVELSKITKLVFERRAREIAESIKVNSIIVAKRL